MYSPCHLSGMENTWSLVCLAGKLGIILFWTEKIMMRTAHMYFSYGSGIESEFISSIHVVHNVGTCITITQ